VRNLIKKILREEKSVNSKENKIKSFIFKLINRSVEGADLYEHKNSIWLIFTDEKKWVIELTKEGTLWYNYYFFDGIFKYLSLDAIENQYYITEWVEDTIKNGVRYTSSESAFTGFRVEDTIKKGTKIGKVKND
jgi:hypothetical protein